MCEPTGTALAVSARDISFDKPCLAAPAGEAFTIEFTNNDPGIPHDVAIYTDESATEALFVGEIFQGVETRTYEVPALDAGTYFFRCDVPDPDDRDLRGDVRSVPRESERGPSSALGTPCERPARRLARPALALASGAALALAFPPFGLGLLALVAPAGLLLAIGGSRPLARMALGALFGLAFFGVILAWVVRAGLHAWIALTVTEAAFTALFALAAGRALDRGPIVGSLGSSALWVLVMEALRSRFPLGGFPWGSLGDPLVGSPLAALAPVAGGIGVAWLAAYVSALVAAAVDGWVRPAAWGLVPVVALVALSLPFAPRPSNGPTLDVAIVQGNVPLPPEPASRERTALVLGQHVALTRTIPAGSVDLVVWPEGVVDLDGPRPSVGEPAPPTLAELAGTLDAWFLAGVVSDAGPGRFRNSVLSVRPSGSVAGVYDKQHPVPFGEYVPWRPYLGFISALRAVPKDMVPGADPRSIPVPGGRVGTPISYEVMFPWIVAGLAARGAEAIVVPTNTSSFGPDAATAEQQLLSTRMRARELGLWVVQSAPSGISAVVDPSGQVVVRTELYEATILRGLIRLAPASTPFARWGEGPPVLLAFVTLLLVAGLPQGRRIRRRSRA
ncbi:MAG: apolipoprotein N-acyltransferase [Actinomycetota bacterium]